MNKFKSNNLFSIPNVVDSSYMGTSPNTLRIIGVSDVSKRQNEDFYATDPIAAEWLLKIEQLNKNIWECACGTGSLSKVFEDHGFNVKSTDLIDRGYGTPGIDFLKCFEKFDGDIVTNPPYALSTEFIYKALELVNVGCKVCMFLKVQFLEGKNRRKLFDEFPPKTV